MRSSRTAAGRTQHGHDAGTAQGGGGSDRRAGRGSPTLQQPKWKWPNRRPKHPPSRPTRPPPALKETRMPKMQDVIRRQEAIPAHRHRQADAPACVQVAPARAQERQATPQEAPRHGVVPADNHEALRLLGKRNRRAEMARVKRSVNAKKKRREVLEAAKGYRGIKKNTYRKAKEQVMRSLSYAYRDRRTRKRDFRRLWIIRINAGARIHGLSYNQLMHRSEAGRDRARPQGAGRPRRLRSQGVRRRSPRRPRPPSLRTA